MSHKIQEKIEIKDWKTCLTAEAMYLALKNWEADNYLRMALIKLKGDNDFMDLENVDALKNFLFTSEIDNDFERKVEKIWEVVRNTLFRWKKLRIEKISEKTFEEFLELLKWRGKREEGEELGVFQESIREKVHTLITENLGKKEIWKTSLNKKHELEIFMDEFIESAQKKGNIEPLKTVSSRRIRQYLLLKDEKERWKIFNDLFLEKGVFEIENKDLESIILSFKEDEWDTKKMHFLQSKKILENLYRFNLVTIINSFIEDKNKWIILEKTKILEKLTSVDLRLIISPITDDDLKIKMLERKSIAEKLNKKDLDDIIHSIQDKEKRKIQLEKFAWKLHQEDIPHKKGKKRKFA